jgi:hypothetical protein
MDNPHVSASPSAVEPARDVKPNSKHISFLTSPIFLNCCYWILLFIQFIATIVVFAGVLHTARVRVDGVVQRVSFFIDHYRTSSMNIEYNNDSPCDTGKDATLALSALAFITIVVTTITSLFRFFGEGLTNSDDTIYLHKFFETFVCCNVQASEEDFQKFQCPDVKYHVHHANELQQEVLRDKRMWLIELTANASTFVLLLLAVIVYGTTCYTTGILPRPVGYLLLIFAMFFSAFSFMFVFFITDVRRYNDKRHINLDPPSSPALASSIPSNRLGPLPDLREEFIQSASDPDIGNRSHRLAPLGPAIVIPKKSEVLVADSSAVNDIGHADHRLHP